MLVCVVWGVVSGVVIFSVGVMGGVGVWLLALAFMLVFFSGVSAMGVVGVGILGVVVVVAIVVVVIVVDAVVGVVVVVVGSVVPWSQ